LVAVKRPREASLAGFVIQAVHFPAVIIAVLLGGGLYTVVLVLDGIALIRFAGAVTVFAIVARSIEAKPMPGFVMKLLRYSVPIGLSSVLGTLTIQLHRLLIARFFDVDYYAIYVNGAVEIPFDGIVTSSVMSVVTPAFVRLYASHDYDEIVRLWQS